jgi:aspartate/tyrosine/aromatic aminotransferase
MRNRINGLRMDLVEKIQASGIRRDFSFLQRQSGMFSFLGLSVDQVRRLRDEFSIYTVDSARANIASFKPAISTISLQLWVGCWLTEARSRYGILLPVLFSRRA